MQSNSTCFWLPWGLLSVAAVFPSLGSMRNVGCACLTPHSLHDTLPHISVVSSASAPRNMTLLYAAPTPIALCGTRACCGCSLGWVTQEAVRPSSRIFPQRFPLDELRRTAREAGRYTGLSCPCWVVSDPCLRPLGFQASSEASEHLSI